MSRNVDRLIGKYIGCGIAYATNKQIRKDAASGGLVTVLLTAMLRKGFIDGALVVKNNGLKQKGVIARTEKEIISAAGSKYVQIPLNAFLNKLYKEEGKFAFVGLPCHLRGLKKLESFNPKITDKIVLKIGLFCSHAVTYTGMVFLLDILGVKPEEVTEIKYRAKKKYTTGIFIRTLKGKEIFIPSSKYWKRFFNFFFIPDGCLSCKDLGAELSDISIGDAWGFDETERLGLSIFITRSETGKKAINMAESEKLVKVKEVSPETVVKSQIFLVKKKMKYFDIIGKVKGSIFHIIQIGGRTISKNKRFHTPLKRLVKLFLINKRDN